MSADPEAVIARAVEAGRALRGADVERRVGALVKASAILGDAGSRLGRQAREVLPSRSGLGEANVQHTLRTSLSELRRERLLAGLSALGRAHAGRTVSPARLAAFVLAGNVYTACLRPLAWALLAGVPVVIKPSSQDEGLAELFAIALAEADPELGEALALLRFSRADTAALERLAHRADVVHAWGSDRSVAAVRAALPATTAFVAHGHGLGAAYVPAAALATLEGAERAAAAIALDVALYDQRGCLSPHFVLVERGGPRGGRAFAEILAERGLCTFARTIPRGPLPLWLGAQQVQWRGVGASRGELFEGDGYAATFEGAEPLRLSPGHRNVGVYEVDGPAELTARLAPFGHHLKALGVAGAVDLRARLASLLPPPLCPRVSEVGAMQTPGLLAAADGEPPWTGLLRLVDVD